MKNNSKGISKDKQSEGKSKLPFEPASNRKKSVQAADSTSAKSAAVGSSDQPTSAKTNRPSDRTAKLKQSGSGKKAQSAAAASSTIPELVSQRMARRIAFFSGIPTGLGMLTFVVSYFVVSQHLYKLPTVAVLFVSLGFFGLGVLGLSYGALSASWDEDRTGTWFGWSEFRENLGRAIASWKAAKPKP